MSTQVSRVRGSRTSPIRWAGSKRKLLPTLESYWLASGGQRYLEAFAGSAVLFFAVRPRVSILNDSNVELVSALECLAKYPRLIHEALSALPPSKELYYNFRALVPAQLDPIDRAVRFFYLNRYCFNGIYRTNQNGSFNVPFAGIGTGGFPPIEEWVEFSKALQHARIHCEDFEEFLLREVQEGDFVYLDPPYAVSNRRVFSQYSPGTFGLKDMSRLGELMDHMQAIGAKFLVSYAESPEAKSLCKKWIVRREYAQRNVSGFATHRRRALEVLISNFDPELEG